MTSMTLVAAHRRVVIGVDTHKYIHVAVALDDIGALLDARSFGADRAGYEQLLDWAASLGGKLTPDPPTVLSWPAADVVDG